jgi:phosphocarrier protein
MAREQGTLGGDAAGAPGESGGAAAPARSIEITNTYGLHLRAASKFARLAQQFQADVWVGYDGRKVNGRSILDLTTLAAACGSSLEVEANGSDAAAALEALIGLIARRFDEQEG